MDLFECSKIDSKVFQLGLILFPMENVNERFLLKLRNCIVALDESHVLKKWIIKASNPQKNNEKQFENISKILTTKFNLITDPKQKTEVVDFLKSVAGESVLDKILRSYLYLILGNVAESNNQLKSIYVKDPSHLFLDYQDLGSLHISAGLRHIEDILNKLSSHPSDRIHYNLLVMYLKSFFNSKSNIELLNEYSEIIPSNLLRSAYVKNMAPSFLNYLNRSKENLEKMDSDFLFYWVFPFHESDNLSKAKTLSAIEYGIKKDYLWSIYAINSERMIDLALKETSSFSINNRRSFLRQKLKDPKVRNLAVYKLIELGDIDDNLIHSVLENYHD